MSLSSLLSVGAAGLAAILAIIMLVKGGTNLTLQSELQTRTQVIQTQQQEIELQKQQFQAQQQQINTAQQLAQQQGPQVIGSLKIAAMRSNNTKILAMLAKYNVTITPEEKDQIKKLIDEGKATAPVPAPKPAANP